jgi:hypothetical protein
MLIEKLGVGPWADVEHDGMSMVSIDGEPFDLDAVRGDSESMVALEDDAGSFVAHIVTPPDRHTTIFEGRVDENGDPVPSVVAMPLEMDKVKVTLWTKNVVENTQEVEE